MKFHKYIVSTDSIDHKYSILFNLLNGVSIKYSKRLFSEQSLLNQPDIKQLFDEEKFFESTNTSFGASSSDNERTLNLILLVYENCNFRCTYCYEKFEKNAMSQKIMDSILLYIKTRLKNERDSFDRVQISWFGGEPLLNFQGIKYLSKKIITLCQEFDIPYEADMTTNGFLLSPKIFKELVRLQVKSFQITVDGVAEYHDKLRVLKNGHPTYFRIMENLKGIRQVVTNPDVLIVLRTNVGKDNYNSMDAHIQQLVQNFQDDNRFYLYFHNIGNWGENENNILEKDIRRELTQKTLSYGGQTLPFLWDLMADSICYAAKPNHFVIGSDGIVYKCTVDLYSKKNQIGCLKQNGEMKINAEKESYWLNSPITGQCTECQLLPVCYNNRCPLKRLDSNQALVCPENKELLEESVQMVDLQDCITYCIE